MLAVESQQDGDVEQCAHSLVPHDAGILGIGSIEQIPNQAL
jgi:hypothetical protein